MQLRHRESGALVASELRPAHTHWTRLKGLLGTKSLPDGQGLWIKPCTQVHMYGMRYAVDLIFVDKELRIIKLIENQPVGSLSPKFPEAESVIELPVGTLARAGLDEGGVLEIDGQPDVVEGRLLEALGAWGCNLLLAAMYGVFAYQHYLASQRFGQWATATPIILQETMLMFLFLTRRRTKEVSTRPLDWVLGIVGTGFPLLFRPTPTVSAIAGLAQPVQVLGLALAALGTISLGRSIGVVAGNRGVKTSFMHGVVRHPMYMGYLVGYIAYVGVYPSLWNIGIILGTIIALNGRAIVEERFLQRDPQYRDYLQRVRWRFLPYIY